MVVERIDLKFGYMRVSAIDRNLYLQKEQLEEWLSFW